MRHENKNKKDFDCKKSQGNQTIEYIVKGNFRHGRKDLN